MYRATGWKGSAFLFRHPNTADGHIALVAMIQRLSGPVKVGFEARGGREWVLWTELIAAGIITVQLSPAQIKAFALSRGTLAKTDRIDAELIARLMAFRPEAERELPDENISILRTLTTRWGQLVDMRKRLKAQISTRRTQGVSADVEIVDGELKEVLASQIDDIERRTHCDQSRVIGPVSAAMLIAGLPELGRMTSGEAAAMIGLAPVPHDGGAMRGRRMIAGRRRSLRHVLFQAVLAAACHNPVLKPVAKRLKERGKSHKLVIIAISQSHEGWSQSQTRSSKPARLGSLSTAHKHSCYVFSPIM